MGEYVMAFDGMRGEALVIMTVILLLFLVNIPMLWGFSVARHERTPS
jgi:RsiW-degrading membrane proteinase PrsW (M82 family)